MQIGIDTNLQTKNFSEKKGHHHPAMGPVSNSVPPPDVPDHIEKWLLLVQQNLDVMGKNRCQNRIQRPKNIENDQNQDYG